MKVTIYKTITKGHFVFNGKPFTIEMMMGDFYGLDIASDSGNGKSWFLNNKKVAEALALFGCSSYTIEKMCYRIMDAMRANRYGFEQLIGIQNEHDHSAYLGTSMIEEVPLDSVYTKEI